MATLLSMIQDACDVIGLARPASVVGGSDQNVRTMLGIANREGRELAKRFDWQVLQATHTFLSVAAEEQDAIPADFARFIDESFWNRSQNRPVLGPTSPEEWEELSATSAPAVTDYWRRYGNLIFIKGTPTAGETYAYGYVSKNWVYADDGTLKSSFTLDTDIPLLDDELITLGVIWRFARSRGLDYSEDRQTYERAVSRAMASDGGRRTLNFSGEGGTPPGMRIPEGNWSL